MKVSKNAIGRLGRKARWYFEKSQNNHEMGESGTLFAIELFNRNGHAVK